MTTLSEQSFDAHIYKDHNEVRDLYNRYKGSTDISQKRELLNSLIRELAVHSVSEEINVYPRMESIFPNGKQIADHSREEHQELKNLLYKIDKMSIEDPGLNGCLKDLMDHFEVHAKDEESRLIPDLRKSMNDEEAVKLGSDFQATKATAPTHPHPSAPNKAGIMESMAGFMAKPVDALKDASRKFAQ